MESKYLTIYNEISNKIENNKIQSGEKLSSENEMMKEYNVSRDTIRKALNLLENNGYIQKVKGKGSFVLDINKFDFPVSGLTSFKELSTRMGVESNTLVKELKLIKPDNFLMKQLNLSKNDDVWKVIRVREIDNKKIILDKDFFNKKYVPLLTKDICENSIYEYLENELGLKISFAKKEITVQQATQEDKSYLDFENYNMIVVVKNYIYLDDMSLFQYTESRHRPDRFKFVEFARRK
ncbi:trehalose operon repressor [Clostridium botulinum]|uniref:Trehalose operon repressor n=1 Tax=Clostridium botulinum (strain Langeland / NCTC 10281 / Type F) TaxID=441772 RepID=A7GEV3_CLOBL|nr:trehalose operon repressor [Clostridium botulinum]ABS42852.1 trehalose operon repressor [Clostridium botulinum F str. Langeland]ADF99719.1 trehalose operon repressor [Clostridium botulinum F str. 230613]KKM42700.1 trehalose operon transcriptional repressor [Clostridium botulinum]MBY6791783.1 trehalose operon repressor [Clostridium botulinum]MBY6937020.1 trehalose operon repressor [Clostridium botulinum]